MNLKIILSCVSATIFLFLSSATFAESPKMIAKSATEWTELFNRTEGWIGGDGIFSANLDGSIREGIETRPNQRTLFVFSDTLVGRVDLKTGRQSNVRMPNHSFALLDGNKPDKDRIEFFYPDGDKTPSLPIKPSQEKQWYWLSECFVLPDKQRQKMKLYAFLLRMGKAEGDGAFGFRHLGVDLLCMELRPGGRLDFSTIKVIEDKPSESRLGVYRDDQRGTKTTISFGIAVLENIAFAGAPNPDGYLYVYGYRDEGPLSRKLAIARCKPENVEDFGRWEYYAGKNHWSNKLVDAVGVVGSVSTELSVSPILSGSQKGKYALVYTPGTIGSKIALRLADSPVGPFGEERILYEENETKKLGKECFAYNAKAHPVLSRSGEMLISYNINSNDSSFRIFREADIYRPRFVVINLDDL